MSETLEIIEKLKEYNELTGKQNYMIIRPDYSGTVYAPYLRGIKDIHFKGIQDLRDKLFEESVKFKSEL